MRKFKKKITALGSGSTVAQRVKHGTFVFRKWSKFFLVPNGSELKHTWLLCQTVSVSFIQNVQFTQ